jgi:hypothetical protein
MTSKNQTQTQKSQAVELQEAALDDVSGGPIYVKVDGIVSPGTPLSGDGSVKTGIVDGTSNTAR